MYTHMYIYIYTHIYIYVYIYIYMYLYMHRGVAVRRRLAPGGLDDQGGVGHGHLIIVTIIINTMISIVIINCY